MDLIEITDTQCSDCGATTVAESQKQKHTNGHYFETREFGCGRVIKFIPNFMRTETQTPCPKSNAETQKKQKREKAMSDTLSFIEKLDVDSDWKQDKLKWIKY